MEVIGDYTLSKQVLGQGSFSTVYLGTNSRTNELVAIKQVKHQINKKMQDNLEREIAFLKRFRHPNIVALHGTVMHHERYIILEYCPGGDLHAFIKAHQRLTEDVALHFLRQVRDQNINMLLPLESQAHYPAWRCRECIAPYTCLMLNHFFSLFFCPNFPFISLLLDWHSFRTRTLSTAT
ncbi:unnamed protein product [Chrysoparadoxa australica]